MMIKDPLPAIVLAGYNKGKYLERELSEKQRMGNIYGTKFKDGKKIYEPQFPGSNKLIMEYSLDAILGSNMVDKDRSFIIGDKEIILKKKANAGLEVYEQQDNLFSNLP